MTRKTRTVKVPPLAGCDNRDLGKIFFIEEWPASRADRWIQRLAFTFNKAGGQLPTDLRGIGWEGLAIIGINTFLRGNVDPDVMIPIGDELLECVRVVRDPKYPDVVSDLMADMDIEEVTTRWWLRDQVVSVHTNFSFLDALSRLVSSVLSQAPETPPPV